MEHGMTEIENETFDVGDEEEFDLSGAGIQPRDVVATISEVEIESRGGGRQATVTFDVEEEEYPVKVRAWLTHDNPKAQQIGQSKLKNIARAATGDTTFSRDRLVDATVRARLVDDGNGFATLTNFKSLN